jgi:hypothetical protein
MRALSGEGSPEGRECEGDLAEVIVADWALGRESELARLEKESAELRRMLGVTVDTDSRSDADGSEEATTDQSWPWLARRIGARDSIQH